MKNTVFILLMMPLLNLNILSQTLSKMGENYMKQYKLSVEKLKQMNSDSPKIKGELANADRLVKSIQKSDPAYDVSYLVKELNVYRGDEKNQLSNNGKTYLKEVEKRFDVLQNIDPTNKTYQDELILAKRNIEYLSKSDPNYDLSGLNEKLADFNNKLKIGKAKNDETRKNKEGLDSKLQEFLETSLESTYSKQTVADNKIEIEKFKNDFSAYIQNSLVNDASSKSTLQKIEMEWNSSIDIETLESYKNSVKSTTNETYAESCYDQINLIEIKWSLLKKAFPASEILAQAVNKIKESEQFEGGKEGVIKMVKANKLEETKKTRMTPCVNSNESLKEEIKTALKESKHCKGRIIIKINILRSDWAIQRHELTGKILGRAIDFEAALKNTDGSCVVLKSPWFHQNYNGSGYGKGYVEHGDVTDIICENVNK
ncbi:MAG: hypothetical protein JNJ41_13410 [Bacteroidia bacterium]|nr:hypothetical protein [Bacteroidia bacterium]